MSAVSAHAARGSAVIPSARHPNRTPAMYVVGYAPSKAQPEAVFRLPCPPRWDDRPLGTLAAERRVRKAYFATLDALRTGKVEPDRAGKIMRLSREVRSDVARAALDHLRRVLRFVRWSAGGWPVIPAPEVPLSRIVVTVPQPAGEPPTDAQLAERYEWALEWMRTHRWVVWRGLSIEWRMQRDPASETLSAVAVAVEPCVRPAVVAADVAYETAEFYPE